MAEDTTTPSSGNAGATPATGSSATDTPASQGATPAKTSTMTLEEAMARIADLERHSSNKEEQAARHGKSLSALQKELDSYKDKERQAQEAALTEAQKLEKRASDAEQLIQQYKQQLIETRVQLAAKDKGIIDAELASLAIQKSLEFGDDGMPTNLDEALTTLIKNKPYLAAPKPAKPAEDPAPESPAQSAPKPQAPAIPAMNPPREGRTNIPSPGGTLSPGKPTRLSDLQWSR